MRTGKRASVGKKREATGMCARSLVDAREGDIRSERFQAVSRNLRETFPYLPSRFFARFTAFRARTRSDGAGIRHVVRSQLKITHRDAIETSFRASWDRFCLETDSKKRLNARLIARESRGKGEAKEWRRVSERGNEWRLVSERSRNRLENRRRENRIGVSLKKLRKACPPKAFSNR